MKNKNNKELKPWEEYDPKPWLSGRVPRGYWNYEDNIRDALKWLFEDILDIENNNYLISEKDFKNNHLYGLCQLFNSSPYEAINYMYPDKYKPWEKTTTPNKYWNDEDNIRYALKWLFEEKLDIEKDIINIHDFRKYNLYGLLTGTFDGSPYEAINFMYPDKYKPWEKCITPQNYWNDENNIRRILKWLLEEKLDIENNDIIVTTEDFMKYNLYGLLKVFNNSPYNAINYLYPNKYKPWEKCNIPNGYCLDEDNIKDALKWLFEEKLDIENSDIIITTEDFMKYRLDGMFYRYFKSSPYRAINYMYPNKYKAWEKSNVPMNYWKNEDNIKDALRWLFEEKCNIDNVTKKDFKKYRLNGLLIGYFDNSIDKVIEYYKSIK